MNIRRIVIIGITSLVMTSCAIAAPENDAPSPQSYTPITFKDIKATKAERRICEAAGGSVMPAGRLGADNCIQQLPDGGQPCRDGDDCLGECFVIGDVDYGTPTTGQCHITDNVFGCAARVEDGLAEPVLCID